jgi:hypothetical protein
MQNEEKDLPARTKALRGALSGCRWRYYTNL